MVRLLTTLSALPTSLAATSVACADSAALATLPDSLTPTPSCTKREEESDPTTWIDPVCAGMPSGSAANAAPKQAASTAAPSAARVNLRVAISLVPYKTHFDVDMVLMP